MRLSDFDYHLPPELIAQTPSPKRGDSRLMVVWRETNAVEHRRFADIESLLDERWTLVLNDTRVIPARLRGEKERTGAKIELLLLKPLGGGVWEALAKPGKRLKQGTQIVFKGGALRAETLGRTDGGAFRFRFNNADNFSAALEEAGETPLPPYIRRLPDASDKERYQCVYARHDGSAAAPTAGLHFTQETLRRLQENGVGMETITLHVGPGTFQPIQTENLENVRLHSERAVVSAKTAERLNRFKEKGGRICAVGTTTVRTLETAAASGTVEPFDGETSLFIAPGFQFKAADAVLTNFHLPKSSLLMLIAAFTGYDLMRAAYETAVRERYRFYSYGDAMLIF